MSIHAVQIVPAEEKYSPPETIIELAVVEDGMDQLVREEGEGNPKYWNIKVPRKLVLLSASAFDENSEGTTIKRQIEFPAIDLNDLIRALNSFGIAGGAVHFGEPPLRVAAPPQEPKPE